MIGRIILLAAIAGLAVGAYVAATRWQIAQAGRRPADPIRAALRPGVPAVVYFWGESCAPCRLVQKPALDALVKTLGPDGVQVIAVNAETETALADGWGVLGLPTTFILDAAGEPRGVNHGVTRTAQLQAQIERLAA